MTGAFTAPVSSAVMEMSYPLIMVRNWVAPLALGGLFLAMLQVLHSQDTPHAPEASPSTSHIQNEAVRTADDLVRQNKFDAAIKLLQPLQAASPRIPRAAHELGLAYYKKADYVLAVTPLKTALEDDANDKEAIQLLGLTYFHIGRPSDAIPLLEKVHSWYPSANVDAAYVLGYCYILTKDYAQARRSFAAMYNVPEDSAASHLFLARMLLRQGFDPVAEEHAFKAVALDPKLPLAHFLLGEFYLYKSDVPKAIEQFELELAVNPAYAGTYDRLGDAYSRAGRFDDAQKLLQRAILLDATASGPYILMGKVLLKKNEPDLALLYLQRAVKMDANNFITHHLLGQALRGVGKNEEAERELKLAEQLQSAQNPKLENPQMESSKPH
jgi:tetratricopeptide (TPR) repeat protein